MKDLGMANTWPVAHGEVVKRPQVRQCEEVLQHTPTETRSASGHILTVTCEKCGIYYRIDSR